jgi:hypothetical protein
MSKPPTDYPELDPLSKLPVTTPVSRHFQDFLKVMVHLVGATLSDRAKNVRRLRRRARFHGGQ